MNKLFATLLLACAGTACAAPGDLKSQLRWIPASLGPGHVTLDEPSRLLLSRSAADRAGLREVGLDFRDVYGVIHAETSWVPRAGMGRNGVVSQGLGQFEPATARAIGLRNADDAVEAVHAAARLLREAAMWSAQRIAALPLAPEQRAAKLREGVSIYYNLSSRARSNWNGRNAASLPPETQRHIRNVLDGARQADRIHARLGGAALAPVPELAALPAAKVMTAAAERAAPVRTAAAQPAAPRALGTIEWSGQGAGGPGAGRRSYVVLSNGVVRPQGSGDVPPGAIRWTRRATG
jgi:hypothetical protein